MNGLTRQSGSAISIRRRKSKIRAAKRAKSEVIAGASVLIGLLIIGIIVPIIVGSGGVAKPELALLPPSPEHWFGTDRYGRDILVRCIAAIRIDVTLAVLVALIGLTVGSVIGAISVLLGGWIDTIVMRLTDILMSFPSFVLALVITASLGNNAQNAVVGVTIAFLPQFIRLTRSRALEVRSADFVAASQIGGARRIVIGIVHVLPNSIQPALVQATLVAAWAVLDIAGLSFLGVGVQPPTAEWGSMIAGGTGDVLLGNWWTALFPGLMIVLAASAFHLLGDNIERTRR